LLPGAHDAGTAGIDRESEWDGLSGKYDSWILSTAARFGTALNKKAAIKRARTQGGSLVEQVRAGVRFLDLRVSAVDRGTDDISFHLTHGLRGSPLATELAAVADFLRGHRGECTVLAVRQMINFEDGAEQKVRALVGLLSGTFAGLVADGWTPRTPLGVAVEAGTPAYISLNLGYMKSRVRPATYNQLAGILSSAPTPTLTTTATRFNLPRSSVDDQWANLQQDTNKYPADDWFALPKVVSSWRGWQASLEVAWVEAETVSFQRRILRGLVLDRRLSRSVAIVNFDFVNGAQGRTGLARRLVRAMIAASAQRAGPPSTVGGTRVPSLWPIETDTPVPITSEAGSAGPVVMVAAFPDWRAVFASWHSDDATPFARGSAKTSHSHYTHVACFFGAGTMWSITPAVDVGEGLYRIVTVGRRPTSRMLHASTRAGADLADDTTRVSVIDRARNVTSTLWTCTQGEGGGYLVRLADVQDRYGQAGRYLVAESTVRSPATFADCPALVLTELTEPKACHEWHFYRKPEKKWIV
jgi:hypothetical protein